MVEPDEVEEDDKPDEQGKEQQETKPELSNKDDKTPLKDDKIKEPQSQSQDAIKDQNQPTNQIQSPPNNGNNFGTAGHNYFSNQQFPIAGIQNPFSQYPNYAINPNLAFSGYPNVPSGASIYGILPQNYFNRPFDKMPEHFQAEKPSASNQDEIGDDSEEPDSEERDQESYPNKFQASEQLHAPPKRTESVQLSTDKVPASVHPYLNYINQFHPGINQYYQNGLNGLNQHSFQPQFVAPNQPNSNSFPPQFLTQNPQAPQTNPNNFPLQFAASNPHSNGNGFTPQFVAPNAQINQFNNPYNNPYLNPNFNGFSNQETTSSNSKKQNSKYKPNANEHSQTNSGSKYSINNKKTRPHHSRRTTERPMKEGVAPELSAERNVNANLGNSKKKIRRGK